MSKVYCTSYCNKGHRMSDGKPVRHECLVIPPEALLAESLGDVARAISLMPPEGKRRIMRRGVRS